MRNKKEIHAIATSPYLAGRTYAADRFGRLAKYAAKWRRISLMLLLCCVACVLFVIFMANRATEAPFIVQVDKFGTPIPVKIVKPSNIDHKLVASVVARYISSLRSVLIEKKAQDNLMKFVENSTLESTVAGTKYQEYYRNNNPHKIIMDTKTSINTIVDTITLLSDMTWQAEWTEEAYLFGKIISTKNYSGIFKTSVKHPESMDEVHINPLGIYITDFDFKEEI